MVSESASRACEVIEWEVEHRAGGDLSLDRRTPMRVLVDLLRVMPGRGWSADACARRMGKSRQAWHDIARRGRPSDATLRAIARCFDLGVTEVAGLLRIVETLKTGDWDDN